MAETAREAGWYADPYERLPYRWWDGEAWTGYASDGDVRWDDVPDEDPEPRPKGVPGVGVALLGFVVGVAGAFLVGWAMRSAHRPGGRATELAASELALWSGLVGACLYASRRSGTGSLIHDFHWRFRPIDIGLGLAGSIAGRLVSAAMVVPFSAFFDSYQHPQSPERSVFDKVTTSGSGWIVLIVVTCVGAPLIEELFFRGLLQSRLVDVLGAARGITVTAVLFGAAHLIAWQGAITLLYGLAIVGAGIVLGLMRHVTGRLGTSTSAHVWFNAQAMVVVALLQ